MINGEVTFFLIILKIFLFMIHFIILYIIIKLIYTIYNYKI